MNVEELLAQLKGASPDDVVLIAVDDGEESWRGLYHTHPFVVYGAQSWAGQAGDNERKNVLLSTLGFSGRQRRGVCLNEECKAAFELGEGCGGPIRHCPFCGRKARNALATEAFFAKLDEALGGLGMAGEERSPWRDIGPSRWTCYCRKRRVYVEVDGEGNVMEAGFDD